MKRGILIVDHGSKRAEANAVLEEIAALVRRALPEAIVRPAHMDIAAPDLAEAFAACVAEGAEEIVIHPYFLGPGSHTTHDIPRLASDAAARHPGVTVRITDPLGVHPKIGEVILERIKQARPLGS